MDYSWIDRWKHLGNIVSTQQKPPQNNKSLVIGRHFNAENIILSLE